MTMAVRCRCEAVVLSDHVCHQVLKRPPDARRGPLEIPDGDMAEDCDAGLHNAAVGAHEIRHVGKANDAQRHLGALLRYRSGRTSCRRAVCQTIGPWTTLVQAAEYLSN